MSSRARFAFISRHVPTEGQVALAEKANIELVHVGDLDAFTIGVGQVDALDNGPFEGVVVVHPAAALRLAPGFTIGVFENANRSALGQPPQFEAVAFHMYDLAVEDQSDAVVR